MKVYNPVMCFKNKFRKSKWWYSAIFPVECETKSEALALAREYIREEKNTYTHFSKYLMFRAKVRTVVIK